MTGLVPDANVEGQFFALLRILSAPPWDELWNALGLTVHTFKRLGLQRDVPDAVLWRMCQDQRLVLVTGNRNHDGPDSLEAVIRQENYATCVPVITIGDVDRIMEDRDYANRAASRLMDYLFDIKNYLGTGRIYIP